MLKYLSVRQKEAIGLLQIGTLLEYFDLMLFVHMSVLLNDLFFPKSDPHTASLIYAFALCSAYILRPFGALLFGYIGDNFGRKVTVVISSFMMAFSCIIMANLPTYEQIGITAAWGITLCRVLQGLSCQGELIGVEIYLTEITKPPVRYPVVSLTSFFSSLGGMFALGLANLLNTFNISWRMAFWIGAAISSIGFTARARLRETPEFIKMQKRQRSLKKEDSSSLVPLEWSGYTKYKTIFAYFLISCGFPACFYLSYIHCGGILKNAYGFTSKEIIHHNFLLSIVHCTSFILYSLASYKINPLTILKIRLYFFFPFILFYPYFISVIATPNELFIFQSIIIGFSIVDVPAAGIIMNHFPVLKRITSTSLIYAFSRVSIYVITSFGMVYLTDIFNNWGVWFLMIILCIGFSWSIRHYETLEKMKRQSLFYFITRFVKERIKKFFKPLEIKSNATQENA